MTDHPDTAWRAPTGGIARQLTLHGIREPVPGPRWQALFQATWPGYRQWYLGGDAGERPDLRTATTMLSTHMPELLGTYQRLVELAGGDETAARMLTLWNPPRFAPGCSQLALARPTPVLCRNYDYSPQLFEGVVYSSRFTERRVIGTSDCLWGLLDGMNDAGLVVSLAFGGTPGSGTGFGIPLVVRYLLEVAGSAGHAGQLLRRLPVAMSYNLTVADRTGAAFTAFLAPDRAPEFSAVPAATNHRGTVPDFPEMARALHSVERREALLRLVASEPRNDELVRAFLTPPLYNTGFSRAFGTLYTALYDLAEGHVDYHWPGQSWRRGFDDADAVMSATVWEQERQRIR